MSVQFMLERYCLFRSGCLVSHNILLNITKLISREPLDFEWTFKNATDFPLEDFDILRKIPR